MTTAPFESDKPPARADRAAYRPARSIAVTPVDDGSVVYVAQLPGGPLFVLEGVAAAIWTESTRDPAQGWIARVAATFAETEEAVTAEVSAFVADLVERGLLEVTTPPDATG